MGISDKESNPAQQKVSSALPTLTPQLSRVNNGLLIGCHPAAQVVKGSPHHRQVRNHFSSSRLPLATPASAWRKVASASGNLHWKSSLIVFSSRALTSRHSRRKTLWANSKATTSRAVPTLFIGDFHFCGRYESSPTRVCPPMNRSQVRILWVKRFWISECWCVKARSRMLMNCRTLA